MTCDIDRRILDFSIKSPGGTGDSLGHKDSPLGMHLANGKLPNWAHLLGDAAYIQSEYMMVPIRGTISEAQDAYNYEQSSLRMSIECTFGILLKRWGILWRPLQVRHDRAAHLVACCARLHNLCIDYRICADELGDVIGRLGISAETAQARPYFDRDGRPVELLTGDDTRPPEEGGTGKRNALVEAIHAAGVHRPSGAPVRRH